MVKECAVKLYKIKTEIHCKKPKHNNHLLLNIKTIGFVEQYGTSLPKQTRYINPLLF